MPRGLQARLIADAAKLAATLELDSATARIEAQSLLQHVLQVSRAWVLAHDDALPTAGQENAYGDLLQRRLHGEPLAYLLGEREFFGLPFKVTPATLIPRPETELLVELALERIPPEKPTPAVPPLPLAGESWGKGKIQSPRILDLGTGSGAIALSIAHARPHCEALACDISLDALAVARENAQRLHLRNVAFLQSDWYQSLDDLRFDCIVSNPPYIATDDPHLQQGDLRFEPPSALSAGCDGLHDIRRIVASAPAHLKPGGWLLLEHGHTQAAVVRELLRAAGCNEIFSARDLAGIERASGGRLDPHTSPP